MITHKKFSGGIDGLLKRMTSLGEPEVYIGIPSSGAARGGSINNATLAAIHELGAASRGIPARPFLVPTIKKNSVRYVDLMAQGFKLVLHDKQNARQFYEKIGLQASSDVKEYIANGNFEPLKQETIDRKGSSKPLIDTAELRNSINYEVR